MSHRSLSLNKAGGWEGQNRKKKLIKMKAFRMLQEFMIGKRQSFLSQTLMCLSLWLAQVYARWCIQSHQWTILCLQHVTCSKPKRCSLSDRTSARWHQALFSFISLHSSTLESTAFFKYKEFKIYSNKQKTKLDIYFSLLKPLFFLFFSHIINPDLSLSSFLSSHLPSPPDSLLFHFPSEKKQSSQWYQLNTV